MGSCYFIQPFSLQQILGVRAHLSKCWRGTWSEKDGKTLS